MKSNKIIKELLSYLKIFVGTWIFVWFLTTFFTQPVVVEGTSMYPTLKDGDFGFSNVISVKLSKLERFDIVIINSPLGDDKLVKRIVGFPGEQVDYIEDVLYIDGKPVEESFLNQNYMNEFYATSDTPFTKDFSVTLGDNEYYCIGDNRPNSSDSRVFGPISEDSIISKGVFVIFKGE